MSHDPRHFAAESAAVPVKSALTSLLATYVLRDGEIIILALKPSLWFILISGLRFSAVVLIALLAIYLNETHLPGSRRLYGELATGLIATRYVWAMLVWMSRLYVLTDQRILSIGGVISPNVFECLLKKVARVRIVRTTRERLFGVGSIEIIPQADESPVEKWETVPRPRQVREMIVSAIHRARQGGTAL